MGRLLAKPRTLTIDPSTVQWAWAYWLDDMLISVGREDAPSPIDRLAIESQHRGSNMGTVIKLAQAAGHHVAICGFQLREATWVPPTWKRGFPKPSRGSYDYSMDKAVRRALRPAEAELYTAALENCSKKVKTDLADAVGLGLWLFKRLEGRCSQGKKC